MKKTMKKWMIGLVAIAFMCFATIPVFAEENVIQITSDLCLIHSGDSFEVTVIYGGYFNGVDMRLSYNTDLLEIEDEGSGIESAIISNHDNIVYMNASAVNAMSAKNGNMLTVRFKSKEGQCGDAEISLRVQDLFLNDASYNPVDLAYTVNDQIARQGGVSIQNQDFSQVEKKAVVNTSNGVAEVSGLPENTVVSIVDQTENQELKNRYVEDMKKSEQFKDAEQANLLMVYTISTGDIAFINGKGTVSIPLAENQKGYDTYYVGKEVDGVMVWQKAQVKDGNIIYSTDQLGEVAIVGVKGNDKVSGAYQENKSLVYKSTLPFFFGGILLVGIITAVLMVKKIKKEQSHH